MKNKVINIIGIPLITFSLFVFESSDPQYYLSELFWSFLISLILWQGNGLIIKVLNNYVPWRQPAAPRVLIQIGISAIFTIWLTYFAVKYLYSDVYEAHFSSLVFRKNLFIFLIISLLYNAVYTGSYLFRKWRGSIIESEALKRQNIISQYESLKNQVNPHFLFNSINTMIGLIDENTELAKEYGHQFAEIYRQILVKGKEELITLKEELEIVEIQCRLFESRFGAGLIFNLEVPASYQEKKIPPLTLQMLIENAVKHNMISLTQPLTIKISTMDDALQVSNNIQRKNYGSETTQLGIENIKMRYKFLTNREVVVREDQETFSVVLPLIDQKEK
ncbi:histidine kinase [Fulvivirgaceae bacterium BMA10]|uniref:Histidine kinase n=1 Tax=Splendidivirga corallicola TaxID=3051826 RepID=A0ABT8KSG6_9BACT|nr:histidine kinase [Fulvivirgaceae bacterium BMA10]